MFTYFKYSEFACKCGNCDSDGTEMHHIFVNELDRIRGELKRPLIISSGYRCPEYNMSISTTGPEGPHTTGRAADIWLAGEDVFHFIRHAMVSPLITGIGFRQHGSYAQRFVHVDMLRPHRGPNGKPLRPRVWTYGD